MRKIQILLNFTKCDIKLKKGGYYEGINDKTAMGDTHNATR